MNLSLRSTMIGLVAVLAASSQAAINFSNVVATVTFDGTTVYNLDVHPDSFAIDFTSTVPMLVATGDNPKSAVISISYDATSTSGITGLELIFTGFTLGSGTVDYSESVWSEGSEIASVSGTKSGNGAWVQTDFLSFGQSLTEFSVQKTFDLSLGEPNGPSLASVGLIEQNAVPEPATMGALAVGALGVFARKRRRS